MSAWTTTCLLVAPWPTAATATSPPKRQELPWYKKLTYSEKGLLLLLLLIYSGLIGFRRLLTKHFLFIILLKTFELRGICYYCFLHENEDEDWAVSNCRELSNLGSFANVFCYPFVLILPRLVDSEGECSLWEKLNCPYVIWGKILENNYLNLDANGVAVRCWYL